ncbi:MAG: sugar transferase [Opitutales bacterium]|nr:sugar transferase [Opitutales bacterium]
MYKNFFKRFLDFTLALCVLIVFSPIILAVSVALHFANKGAGIFFTQARPGKNGKIFRVVKFKTMTDERDAAGTLLPAHQRMTRVGKFLRKSSLDELPQLFNILRGDMSIIGPRPLLPEYLPLYSPEQARRHEIRPGVTGWAQTNGRNAISWKKKFELDVWYVDNVSFALDVKILFLTALKVVKREGVNQSDAPGVEVTMPKFDGTN